MEGDSPAPLTGRQNCRGHSCHLSLVTTQARRPPAQFLHCTVKLLHYSARGNPACRRALLCRGLTGADRKGCETAGKGRRQLGTCRAAPQSHSPPQRSHQTDAFQEEYPNVKLPSRVPKIPNLYLPT